MICYVEDDRNIRELVVYTLAQSGLSAQGFAAAPEFYAFCEKEPPELVLLDIMLPGEDGMAILKRLRANRRTAEIPVMMLTAKGAEYDKVAGLELGADDYLAKPFGMMELLARVKALLRRTAKKQPEVFSSGGLALDDRRHSVSVDGAEIPLTRKEYELLLLLMRQPGVAFTREHLLEQVWDYAYEGGTRTVDVHVQTLRAKLGQAGRLIETVRGVGYRFGG